MAHLSVSCPLPLPLSLYLLEEGLQAVIVPLLGISTPSQEPANSTGSDTEPAGLSHA